MNFAHSNVWFCKSQILINEYSNMINFDVVWIIYIQFFGDHLQVHLLGQDMNIWLKNLFKVPHESFNMLS